VGKEFEERLMLQDAFHGESGDCIRITADGSTENAGSTGMYGDGKVGKGGSGGSGKRIWAKPEHLTLLDIEVKPHMRGQVLQCEGC
jgi:hypothetical protein